MSRGQHEVASNSSASSCGGPKVCPGKRFFPGTPILPQLAAAPVDASIAQAAAVNFKNTIKYRWVRASLQPAPQRSTDGLIVCSRAAVRWHLS
jgi:hypothetical protein